MTPVLTQAQLRRLDEHKYSATGVSVMEPIMQVFWNWLAEKLPLWVAPNLITLKGVVISVLTSLCVIYYTPTAKEEAPAWTYLAAAVGCFAFQTMDALDGKQARRTGSSTPLGDMFDHVCDVVITVIEVVEFCCALRLGETPELLFFFTTLMFLSHFCAMWEIFMTGALQIRFIDLTEGQMVVIAVNVVTALFGPSVWSYQIPMLGLTYRGGVSVVFLTGTLLKVFGCSSIAIAATINNGGITAAGTSVLRPVFPIFCHVALACAFYINSSTNLFQNHPCLYLLMVGLAMAKVTNKLVVAYITKSEMPLLDVSMLCPGLLFLNQCCNCPINEYGLMLGSLVFANFDLTRYFVAVCMQICDHLDIYCFSITSKPPKQD